ncbi:MAG: porphobilinogen synthase, partial [Akkermansia sp.]
MMNLPIRPRRNRKSANIRGLVRETSLSPEHLICPVFVHEGDGNQPISSLPGCTRWSVQG